MKFIIFFSFILFNTSLAFASKLVELSIRPGEVRWLDFPVPKGGAKLFCRESEVKFSRSGERGYAFIVESYFSDLKSFRCKIVANSEIFAEIIVKVEERVFPSEKLKVDPKKIKLSEKDQARVAEEQIVLNKAYASSNNDFYFKKPFMQPMTSLITSMYGMRRVYNKEKKGQHLGTDYRAAIGDKVPASNAGKVVFSGNLFYTGWTVIIDHGLDIFTVYGHLSKTEVAEGQLVQRGDLIGLSGNTGRSSGPHLHWGVKVQGQYIDGLVLIEQSKKYFKE